MNYPEWTSPDGRIRLINADCLDVLPTLEGIDAVVTDPPYGIGGKWKGGFSDKHGWGRAALEADVRNEWDAEPPPQELIDLILSIGNQHIIWGGNYFTLPISRCWLVWNKPERGFTLAECELAWTDFDNVARVYDCRRSDPDRTHPTQKPTRLIQWCVEKTEGTVCDPFGGSMTTAVACVRLDRRCVCIEREPKYFADGVKRLEREYARTELLDKAGAFA